MKGGGWGEGVKVFGGGGAISQGWCDKGGADAYAADALIAVDKARACMNKDRQVKGGDPALHANMLVIDAEREALKAKAG